MLVALPGSLRIYADLIVVDIRQKAIEVTLSVVSGAYQTTLLSYFTHRDLFPSLMKVGISPFEFGGSANYWQYIQDSETTWLASKLQQI